ncbi:MAG TPA: nitrous oxide reductase accessory protein NosL [Microscillaceae bacterium]|nr:nitrous oxide reductase accessory protein NosL [Microscillaceae bacterium]
MIIRVVIYIALVALVIACQSTNKENNTTNTDASSHKGHKHAHNDKENTTTKENFDCRHCGMPSQEYPKWKAKVVTETGNVWYCSPRCMFISTLDKQKGPKGIKSIEVISYYDTKPIDAKTAMYVIGSDVLGPMGHDLVPLKDKAAATDFKNEHKGEAIVTFDKVTMQMIQALVDKE